MFWEIQEQLNIKLDFKEIRCEIVNTFMYFWRGQGFWPYEQGNAYFGCVENVGSFVKTGSLSPSQRLCFMALVN
jgi:hypothetical protein